MLAQAKTTVEAIRLSLISCYDMKSGHTDILLDGKPIGRMVTYAQSRTAYATHISKPTKIVIEAGSRRVLLDKLAVVLAREMRAGRWPALKESSIEQSPIDNLTADRLYDNTNPTPNALGITLQDELLTRLKALASVADEVGDSYNIGVMDDEIQQSRTLILRLETLVDGHDENATPGTGMTP